MAAVINLENFGKRLKKLYSHWTEHRNDSYGGSQVLAVGAPSLADGELRYLKSSSLNLWLLGFEFPDTIMVFAKKQIHFLCSQKKASVLEAVKNTAKDVLGLEVVIHVKAKNDDGTRLIEAIFRALLKNVDGGDGAVIGRIVKEVPEGNLLNLWDSKIKSSNFQIADITAGLSDLFAIKDDSEIVNVKNAAYLTSFVMNSFVVPKLEQVIDAEKQVSHSFLMKETEKVILQPAKMKVKQRKLDPDNIDICYPPIFQSGGEFDLKPNAVSNDSSLYYDSTSVIICAIGARYNSYCANVARSYLFDATPMQKKAYSVLLKAHGAAVAALKPGSSAGSAYKAALGVVEKDAPELAEKLTKSVGAGIGLEFRESSGYILNGRNEKMVKAGMVFNVSLGFQNLQEETKNPKTEKFSLLLSDTVIVSQKGPQVITSESSKAVNDVVYSFKEEEEEEEDDKPEEKQKEIKIKSSIAESLPSRATRSVKHEDTARRQHQADLAKEKNKETEKLLAGRNKENAAIQSSMKTAINAVAYKNVRDVPVAPERWMKIQVDLKHDAFLLPIDGLMVPFHASTVKSITSQQETNRTCVVRISFNIPGTAFSTVKFDNAVFVKEVCFRSKDSKHISQIVQQIKDMRRIFNQREKERAERATLVNQEKLQLAGNRFKPVRLSELWIRPVFGGRSKKMTGTLEAHVNGFRYSTSRDEKVDIMYGNIKHAFVQPAEKEMISLVHFHLHDHIMVGTKKTKDVQFYVEVMDVVQTVGGGKRSAYDPDELEEEQRERERKNKTNMQFENFANAVNNIWEQQRYNLEFEHTFREIGFHGVPYKTQAFIVPTTFCLVQLIENPFLVITVDEVMIVNLERVGLGQKSFDLIIVYKDFKKPVTKICSVPSSSLEGIQEWLDSVNIKYYENQLNMNWPSILKNITDDPESFKETGGWEFLNMDVSDSEGSDKSEMSDEGYEPSDAEPESESEDDGSDSESVVESEDEMLEESSEEEEEEKGKTWEELEREASNADKAKRNHESDSEDDERRRRNLKGFGKSRAGGSSGGAVKKSKYR